MQGLKELSDTELLSEAASQELEQNNLEAAQRMYTELLQKLDAVLAPPIPAGVGDTNTTIFVDSNHTKVISK